MSFPGSLPIKHFTMRILYDHQAFTMQAYGGISRYYAEVIHEFQRSRKLDLKVSLLSTQNENLHLIDGRPAWNYPGMKRIDNNYSYRELFNKLHSWLAISRGKFDLFHPTYYDPYFLTGLGKKPFILTVHDTIHEKFGYRYPVLTGNMPSVNDKNTLIEAASGIITVSSSTKSDLISLYGVPASKIEVVYLASPHPKGRHSSEKELVSGKYLLYIGNRETYKNFNFFIRSIAIFLIKNPDCRLVCAGGGDFNDQELLLFKALGVERSLIFHKVNDEVLPVLYAKALAFVFPSLYEGFGIPVLEAMQHGCPCVLSAAGSLPEVAEEAALYFDPLDSSSILTAVETIVRDPGLRKSLQKAGTKRLQFFSWEKTAELTRQVYEKFS